jgi:glutamate/aspartate transport system substrate-binding protein
MIRTLIAAVALVSLLVAAPLGADALKDIKRSKTFTIGYRADVPPFSSLNEGSSTPEGFSIDLCRIIGDEIQASLGLESLTLDFMPVTAENRFDQVAKGRVDIVCGVSTATLSRQEQVDFTNLYYVTGGSLMTTTATGLTSLNDLSGRRVSVVGGTTTETALRQFLKQNVINANVQAVANHDEALRMLLDGEADAFAADRVTLFGLGIQSGAASILRLADGLFSYEPYAFPVARNDADFRLVVNRALAKIYRSGQIARIYDKWLGRLGAKPSPLLLAMYRLYALPE